MRGWMGQSDDYKDATPPSDRPEDYDYDDNHYARLSPSPPERAAIVGKEPPPPLAPPLLVLVVLGVGRRLAALVRLLLLFFFASLLNKPDHNLTQNVRIVFKRGEIVIESWEES